MNVSYTVSASAPIGVSPVEVLTNGTTSLSDEFGNSIPFSVVVPGPPSFILAATGLLFFLAAWRFGPGRLV